mgnify:CR=1 FL=1
MKLLEVVLFLAHLDVVPSFIFRYKIGPVSAVCV